MTKEQYIEYSQDPIKFVSDYRIGVNAYVKEKSVSVLPMMKFEEAIIEKIHSDNYTIFQKSRQMHFSTLLATYVCWCAIFSHKKNTLIISPGPNQAREMMRKVKVIMQHYFKDESDENLPHYSQNRIELKNGCIIQSVGASTSSGKGESIDFLVLDEFSFVENASDIWMAAGMCLSSTKGKCVMYSSVRYREDPFYKIYEDALNNDNVFSASKILWHNNPHYNYLWYEDIKSRFPNTYKQDYDCIPLNKPVKKKANIITFRIDDWMEKEVSKKLLQKSTELGEYYPISTYLRELILKDLKD